MAVLKQFDRDPVGRFDERHVPVARGAVDGVARFEQPLAGRVDIVDPVGEVPEIAPAGVFLGRRTVGGRPVIGELDLGEAGLPGRGKEDQCEAPGLAVEAARFLEPDELEERDRRVGIGHADHGVEEFGHEINLKSGERIGRFSDRKAAKGFGGHPQ